MKFRTNFVPSVIFHAPTTSALVGLKATFDSTADFWQCISLYHMQEYLFLITGSCVLIAKAEAVLNLNFHEFTTESIVF